MKKFITFNFHDNDFRGPLQEVIRYTIRKADSTLPPSSFRLFILRGLAAFDSIRQIDSWSAPHKWKDLPDFFDEMLNIVEVEALRDLPGSFAGFVYDANTRKLFYHESIQ